MTIQLNGLVKKRGLNEADLNEIKELLNICQEYDRQKLKINWNFLLTRAPEETNDFYYYSDQKLVGYLPLDGFGSDFEITGMVHPAHRRQGIFTLLLKEAQTEAGRRKAHELLLVVEKASVTGQAFARARGAQYSFSEYRLEMPAQNFRPVAISDLRFKQATIKDVDLLTRLHALNFGESEEECGPMVKREIEEDNSRVFIGWLGEVAIGKIGVAGENGRAYIRGVGVIPKYRGHGYGRQLLSGLISVLVAEGQIYFELDVETKNSNALSLYLSRGFQEANAYDYFQLPIL